MRQTDHRGWHARGYLPHFDGGEMVQMITYRLADSLPRDVVKNELRNARTPEQRQRYEALLDAGHGNCMLQWPEAASLVVDAWRHFDGVRYRLHAWVVMPNHVHVVATIVDGYPLERIVHNWKSFTGHALRKAFGCRAVWQADYWDRFIRDERHFAAALAYVEGNPMKAGLVRTAEEWRWSSAAVKRGVAKD